MSVDAPADNGETTVNDLDDFSAEFFGKKVEQSGDQVHDEDGIVEDDLPEETSEEQVDESHEDEESVDGRQEPEKKKRSVQERMNELTKQRYEAERRELETQRQLAQLQEELIKLRNPQKEPEQRVVQEDQSGPNPEAKLENGEAKYPLGEFDPAYIRDLARHTIKQEQDAAKAYREEAEAKERQEAQIRESQVKFTEKLTTYEAEDPEIQVKIMSLDPIYQSVEPHYGQYLINVIRDLDNAPAVLAYLADNPETAKTIVKSGAAAATVALGRLDAQVAKPKTESRKVTAAPEPPVRTRGTNGKFSTAADTENLDDFEKIFFKPKRR